MFKCLKVTGAWVMGCSMFALQMLGVHSFAEGRIARCILEKSDELNQNENSAQENGPSLKCVSKWIDSLGDEDSEARDKAERRLVVLASEIKEQVIVEALRVAVDPEIKLRLGRVWAYVEFKVEAPEEAQRQFLKFLKQAIRHGKAQRLERFKGFYAAMERAIQRTRELAPKVERNRLVADQYFAVGTHMHTQLKRSCGANDLVRFWKPLIIENFNKAIENYDEDLKLEAVDSKGSVAKERRQRARQLIRASEALGVGFGSSGGSSGSGAF